MTLDGMQVVGWRQALIAVIAGGVLLVTACAPATDSDEPIVPDVVGTRYSEETGSLQEVTYDRNEDGLVDAWLFMDGADLERAEMDEDFDGTIDRWEQYTIEGTAAQDGGASLVELSDRADGRVTRREYYQAGVLLRAEQDTNGDGTVNKWEAYEGGVLVSVELDERGAGRPTRRLLYSAGGRFIGVETDADGDGVFVRLNPSAVEDRP